MELTWDCCCSEQKQKNSRDEILPLGKHPKESTTSVALNCEAGHRHCCEGPPAPPPIGYKARTPPSAGRPPPKKKQSGPHDPITSRGARTAFTQTSVHLLMLQDFPWLRGKEPVQAFSPGGARETRGRKENPPLQTAVSENY